MNELATNDHVWKKATDSNVSFKCERCGIRGFLPAKEAEMGVISVRGNPDDEEWTPYHDCNKNIVSSVMNE